MSVTKPPGRIRRGINLAKASWGVLKSDKSLMAFPLLSIPAGLLVGLVLFAPGIAILAADDKATWALVVFGIIAAYGLTFTAIFFAVALAACASKALEGENTTVAQGLAVAKSRAGAIAAWSLVQLTVGLVLNAIQSVARDQGGAGAIIGGILSFVGGVAWAVATFFIVPVLALEGLGPKPAIKRSVGVIKERWGEGVVGSAAIGFVFLPLIILMIAALVGGFALFNTNQPAGVALLAVAALLFALTALVSSSLQAVFRVVVFRYAQDGTVPVGWDEADLAAAFTAKKKRR